MKKLVYLLFIVSCTAVSETTLQGGNPQEDNPSLGDGVQISFLYSRSFTMPENINKDTKALFDKDASKITVIDSDENETIYTLCQENFDSIVFKHTHSQISFYDIEYNNTTLEYTSDSIATSIIKSVYFDKINENFKAQITDLGTIVSDSGVKLNFSNYGYVLQIEGLSEYTTKLYYTECTYTPFDNKNAITDRSNVAFYVYEDKHIYMEYKPLEKYIVIMVYKGDDSIYTSDLVNYFGISL